MTREMDITACHKDYMKYLPPLDENQDSNGRCRCG